jgi:diacylglycerol O-acyltransferase
MPQLSALDAQFLNFETATNVANIAGLAIVDGPLHRAPLQDLLEERLPYVPALRRKLAPVPLGLDHPYWEQEDDLDLDYHVREIGLPPEGDDRQLAEQVARLHARRLDRSRPLWEIYLIHGLAGGRTGLYTKIHHAAVDGVGGADVLAALLDLGPTPAPPPPHAPERDEPPPGAAEMMLRGLARLALNPAHAVRFAAQAVPHLDEIPVLSEVKQVRKRFGMTVNDVVMAVCAGALRRWMDAHGGPPDRALVAGVPFSLRDIGDEQAGNQVTLVPVPLPAHLGDPVERLREVHRAMRRIKERFALAPARWLREFSESMPAALMGLASRSAFGLLGQTAPPINVMVSNVPGPQFPLYVCGVRLLTHYPVSVITDMSGGINITAFSYDGSVDVGVVTDRFMVPDAWELAGHLRESLDELLNAEPSLPH